MKFKSVPHLLVAALSLSTASAASVRGKVQDADHLHERRLGQSGCTFLIAADLSEKGVGHTEDSYECAMDDNTAVPLIMSKSQRQNIKQMIEDGKVTSGEDKYIDNEAVVTPEGIRVPPGKALGFEKGKGSQGSGRRRLVTKTGDTYYLVVRVTDSGGLAYGHSTAVMSDNMFGTSGDAVNLKSQIFDCSAGQLNVVPGYPDSASEAQKTAIDAETVGKGHPVGVMETTIDISLTSSSRSAVRNAVITAVQTQLGFNLPGPFDHVVFNLEGCYVECGWAAYAYINSWNQVYQNRYYYMPGVQIHEYGHNLGMAHSGGLNGATYTDHTCLMGNPLYSDDVGKMCFNPAKSYYIGWYNDGGILTYIPTVGKAWSGTLMGVGEWKDSPGRHPVVVKIETGTNTDYFVGFNRAAGANAQNDEADDLVTIVETGNNGDRYSQSYLKGYIGVGQSYTFSNWQGSGSDLTISVQTINLGSIPGTADVTISYGTVTDQPTQAPVTAAPTRAPVTAPPTDQPTQAPVTAAPTQAPVTAAPTQAPVTAAPSQAPVTAPPTDQPTQAPVTAAPTQAPVTAAPTQAPVTAPPTDQPTEAPITPSPTQAPITAAPTRAPVTAPPTDQPTEAPITPSPTEAPITPSPTQAPITPSPTATCAAKFAPCSSDADCCSRKCTGRGNSNKKWRKCV